MLQAPRLPGTALLRSNSLQLPSNSSGTAGCVRAPDQPRHHEREDGHGRAVLGHQLRRAARVREHEDEAGADLHEGDGRPGGAATEWHAGCLGSHWLHLQGPALQLIQGSE